MADAATPILHGTPQTEPGLSATQLASYGLFGLPLSLVALPIYVYVPKFYSDSFGLSLEIIGIILLAVRLIDAVSDPLFGWWVDHGRQRVGRPWLIGYRRFVFLSLPLLALGYVALFQPQVHRSASPLLPSCWLVVSLVVVYAGFSLANIAYYSWGADLSVVPLERTRITSVREGCGLVGVLAAASIPQIFGMDALSVLFVGVLGATGALLLLRAPHPEIGPCAHPPSSLGLFSTFRVPLSNRRFVALLAIFLANGIASAIPATLVLFYIRDVLQLERSTALLLGVYFLAAACSMPLWVLAARRFGLARAWLAGMIFSVVVFVWVYFLGPGDLIPFASICIVSGMAIGGDLALPPALLAGVIAKGGHRGQREGSYFGLWSLATKLNLALAAGISLPLLGALGYDPAHLSAKGTHALSFGYALVPCGLKLIAAVLLWRSEFVREVA